MNNLENVVEPKKPVMKEHRLHSNIYMKFKNRLNQSMMIESRIAVILG